MIKLFRFLTPYRATIWTILGLLLLQSMADLYLPSLMSDIIDVGVMQSDTGYIWKMGAIMLVVAAGGGICAIASSYFSAQVGVGFGRDLRHQTFSRVEGFSLGEFDKMGTATLITRTTNDVTQVQTVSIMILRMMVTSPIMAIGGIIMAFLKDPTLALVLVAVVPILAITIGIVLIKGVPLFQIQQVKLDNLNRVLREGLMGIRVIRAFDRTDHESQRFEKTNLDLTRTAIQVNQIMAFMMPALMLIMNITSVLIVWFGGLRIDSGHIQIGDMMAFLQYAMQIMFSMLMLSMMFVMIPRAQASAVRINEVLETLPDLTDPVHASPTSTLQGHLEFRNVSFAYRGAEASAIHEISFRASPGQVTAIIGGTGSGKTTLVNLIPCFYDVNSGEILVDGIDIRQMKQEELRAKIGFVPQKAVLFTGSVSDNIRYGNEDATPDEIKHAADVAQATDFILEMKDQFDTQIAQGGNNVSGGQRQRLAIARALAAKPEIYIFDDSFSALDFRTDARLRAALRQETALATVLIVAQRVNTVVDADQIIVLEDGKIVGIGTHPNLLENNAVYREIVSSQLSEKEHV